MDESTICAAALIQAARIAAGLTQAEMAKRLGMSQQAVWALEQDGRKPTIASLQRVAKALGLHLVVEFRR